MSDRHVRGAGPGALPPNPSDALKRVIDRSGEDAARLGHHRIAPEHLLASLLGEADAPAVAESSGPGHQSERQVNFVLPDAPLDGQPRRLVEEP